MASHVSVRELSPRISRRNRLGVGERDRRGGGRPADGRACGAGSPTQGELMTVRPLEKTFSNERIRRSISRILRENVLCSISTVAPGNQPHINTAYFCYTPDLEVYFLSDPDSQHCRNLERHPSLAMTIFKSAQEWGGQDRGLQLFGPCRRTTGRGGKEAERFYAARFSPYAEWMKGMSTAVRRPRLKTVVRWSATELLSP